MNRRNFLKIAPLLVLTGFDSCTVQKTCNNKIQKIEETTTETIFPDTSSKKKDQIEKLVNEKEMFDSKLEAAVKIFPRSEPYKDIIVSAYKINEDNILLPIEYIFGLIEKESSFKPYALSIDFAMGLMQFIRPTANSIGLKKYTKKDSPKLYKLEIETQKLSKEIKNLEKTYKSIMNNFEKSLINLKIPKQAYSFLINLQKTKKDTEKQKKIRNELFNEYKNLYLHEIANNNLSEKDDCLKPQIAITKGIKYLSSQILKAKKSFGGDPIHNIIRGLAAYNCGFRKVKRWYGLPMIDETIDYVRKIMINADKIRNLSCKLFDSR